MWRLWSSLRRGLRHCPGTGASSVTSGAAFPVELFFGSDTEFSQQTKRGAECLLCVKSHSGSNNARVYTPWTERRQHMLLDNISLSGRLGKKKHCISSPSPAVCFRLLARRLVCFNRVVIGGRTRTMHSDKDWTEGMPHIVWEEKGKGYTGKPVTCHLLISTYSKWNICTIIYYFKNLCELSDCSPYYSNVQPFLLVFLLLLDFQAIALTFFRSVLYPS